jgi:hypothetical protein
MKQIKKNNQGYQEYSGGSCFYRTHEEKPNMCLVGCFIPDNKYDERMEDRDATDIIQRFFLQDDMPMNIKLMDKLQEFHDAELDKVSGRDFFDAIEQKLIDMEKEYC